MSCIVLCNIGSDSLSKIDTETLNVKNLTLSCGKKPYGPHGLSVYKNKILSANNYNDSISIIDVDDFSENYNIYAGAHPNDISVYKDKAYILCGDSDSIVVYDLIEKSVQYEIKTGQMPHSIELIDKDIGFITNMYDDTISILDCRENVIIKNIVVGNNPIKVKLSKNNKHLYVCVSCMEYDRNGYISIIDVENLSTVAEIEVGFVPVDLFEDGNYLYVSNLCDESISMINISELREEKKIIVGGMPRGIIKEKDTLFIGDYLNGVLKVVNEKAQKIKVISIGREPNAMTFIKDSTDKL